MELSVFDPIPSGVESKWGFFDGSFIHAVVQLDENAEACLRHDGMGRGGRNMITGNFNTHISEASGGQEFFDRKMRKLNDLGTI